MRSLVRGAAIAAGSGLSTWLLVVLVTGWLRGLAPSEGLGALLPRPCTDCVRVFVVTHRVEAGHVLEEGDLAMVELPPDYLVDQDVRTPPIGRRVRLPMHAHVLVREERLFP